MSLDAAAFHKRVLLVGSIAGLELKQVKMLLSKPVKMPDRIGSLGKFT